MTRPHKESLSILDFGARRYNSHVPDLAIAGTVHGREAAILSAGRSAVTHTLDVSAALRLGILRIQNHDLRTIHCDMQ